MRGKGECLHCVRRCTCPMSAPFSAMANEAARSVFEKKKRITCAMTATRVCIGYQRLKAALGTIVLSHWSSVLVCLTHIVAAATRRLIANDSLTPSFGKQMQADSVQARGGGGVALHEAVDSVGARMWGTSRRMLRGAKVTAGEKWGRPQALCVRGARGIAEVKWSSRGLFERPDAEAASGIESVLRAQVRVSCVLLDNKNCVWEPWCGPPINSSGCGCRGRPARLPVVERAERVRCTIRTLRSDKLLSTHWRRQRHGCGEQQQHGAMPRRAKAAHGGRPG